MTGDVAAGLTMTSSEESPTAGFGLRHLPPAQAIISFPSSGEVTTNIISNDSATSYPPCLVSSLLRDKLLVTTVVEVILMVAILFGNVLVALVVIKTPRLRTHTNMCILSLTASDFLTGISIAVILGTLHVYPNSSGGYTYTCSLRHSFLMVAWMGSLHSILAITADRFIAILWPLSYPTIVTRTRVTICIAALWTYSAIVSASAFWFSETTSDGWEPVCDLLLSLQPKYQIYCIVNSMVVIIIICCLYCKIVYVARSQALRQGAFTAVSETPRKWWQILRDKKYIRTAVLVFGVITFFSLPVVIVLSVQILHGASTPEMQTARMITSFLNQSTSVLNPLVYIWRNDDFSRALKKCCGFTETPKSSVGSNSLPYTLAVISENSSKPAPHVTVNL